MGVDHRSSDYFLLTKGRCLGDKCFYLTKFLAAVAERQRQQQTAAVAPPLRPIVARSAWPKGMAPPRAVRGLAGLSCICKLCTLPRLRQ